MKLVNKNVKLGWLSGIKETNEFFPYHDQNSKQYSGRNPNFPEVTSLWTNKFFAQTVGDGSEVMVLYPEIPEHAKNVLPSAVWSESYKPTWNEFEDGTYISVSLPFMADEGMGNNRYYGMRPEYFETDVSINGRDYTLSPLRSWKTTNKALPDDEYGYYILNSTDASWSTWGSRETWPCFAAPPEDKTVYKRGKSPNMSTNTSQQVTSSYPALNDFNSDSATFRLILKPKVYKPTGTVASNLGTFSDPFKIPITVPDYLETNLAVEVKAGESVVYQNASYPLVANQGIEIEGEAFDKIPDGINSITITVRNSLGDELVLTTSMTKYSQYIRVEGVPVDYDQRPKKCTLIYATVLAEGAPEKWYVCNNANDSTPSWELYQGSGHEFLNATKTAEKWAVSWKCDIGSEDVTARSELLKQVGMAVI